MCSCATQFLPLRGGGPAGPSSDVAVFCAGRVPLEGHARRWLARAQLSFEHVA